MQAYQNAERPRPAKDDAHLAEAQDSPRACETPAHAAQTAEHPRQAKGDANLAEAQDSPRACETPEHAAHTAEQLNKFKAQSTDKKTRVMHHKTFGPNSKGDAISPSTR